MSLLLAAVLISGLFQGLILIALLLAKEINLLQNRLLAALILLFVVHLALVAIDVHNHFLLLPHLSKLSWVLPLLYGPLIICLTESIVGIGFRLTLKHLLLLVPFFLYLIILSPYFLNSAEEKKLYLSDLDRVAKDDFGWMNQLTAFIHLAYVTAAFIIFYRKSKRLPLYFSDPARVKLNWLKNFLEAMLLIIVLSALSFYAKKYQFSPLDQVYPANFILLVALVYWMGYRLIQDPTIFSVNELGIEPPEPGEEPEELLKPEGKYQKSALSKEELDRYAKELRMLMESTRPYLNPNLTINDLCSQLLIKRHQLSQVINAAFGENFFEFINDYRIREFKQQVIMDSNQRLSILGIALNAGFNSKATFNAAFKKAEGITPSEYILQVKQQKEAV